ncbi:unnamed protein product [Mytilus edulis]|uniref:Uncharacterized protein n=1 Tax=Mytilus edulis TaxID=6550 RepID=A0A8S3RU95_MYTED|nr:unnamed protein product [Mytilus edulis]
MSATSASIPMSSQYIPQGMGGQQVPPVERQQQEFPVRTLKVFGGIHIGFGFLLGILSLIGVILDVIARNKYEDCLSKNLLEFWMCRPGDDGHAILAFDITCLICSGWDIQGVWWNTNWFVLTGFLPMCMSKKRESSWKCLKVGFMVCSIIGASIFFLTVFILGVVGAFLRRSNSMLSISIATLSFAEAVLAIISASYCCCCTTWRISSQTQRVLFVNSSQSGPILNVPQTNVVMDNVLQMSTDHTGNPVVQYPRAQQYQIINTNEPITEQIQPGVNAQSGMMNIQQQVFNTSPPPYKE